MDVAQSAPAEATPQPDNDFLRIPTGIPGLDAMMEGGLPFPSTVLVAGPAGTGKTTFALQYLAEGVRQGHQGLFFTTLSEPTQWMLRFVQRYTFLDRDSFGKQIKFVELGPALREGKDTAEVLGFIEDRVSEVMPQRIVIDPITVVGGMVEGNYRTFLYDLTTRMKNWQSSTVMTGEVLPDQLYPIEVSYTVDMVLLLTYGVTQEGARRKYLEILKMRGTNHLTGRHIVDISSKGFCVQPGLR